MGFLIVNGTICLESHKTVYLGRGFAHRVKHTFFFSVIRRAPRAPSVACAGTSNGGFCGRGGFCAEDDISSVFFSWASFDNSFIVELSIVSICFFLSIFLRPVSFSFSFFHISHDLRMCIHCFIILAFPRPLCCSDPFVF